MRRRHAALFALFALAVAQPAFAQGRPGQEKPENLKVLPKDITREQLLGIMRGFALGLGVRCEYCHAEKEGAPAAQPGGGGGGGGPDLDFKADKKVTKEKARTMLRMVSLINDSILPKLKERADPPVRVQCVTCHRGSPIPKTLETIVVETTNKAGVDSAIAQYRKLRETALTTGRYNFGEVTLSEAARTLVAQNKTDEAVKLLAVNEELFPQSAQASFQIAEIYRQKGDKAKAIEYYQKVLAKNPNNQQAKRRLAELGG